MRWCFTNNTSDNLKHIPELIIYCNSLHLILFETYFYIS